MARRAALVAVSLTVLAMTGTAPAVAASGDPASAGRAAAAAAPAVAAQPVYTQGIGLQDAQTHRCLDSNTAGSVYTNPCQFPGNHYQVWEMTEWQTSSGQLFFSYKDFATNRCLDGNASGLGHLYTTNPTPLVAMAATTRTGGGCSDLRLTRSR